nr:hypothetical protein [Brucella anthropi]
MFTLIHQSKNGCVVNPFEIEDMTVEEWYKWVGFAETILIADGKFGLKLEKYENSKDGNVDDPVEYEIFREKWDAWVKQ